MQVGHSQRTVPTPRGRGSETTLLVCFVVLLSALPSLVVVPGFGAAGRPAALFALGLFVWWALERLLPRDEPRIDVPLLYAMYVYVVVFAAAVAAGLDRGLPLIEANALDRTALVVAGYAGVVLVAVDGLRTIDDIERVLSWVVAGAAIGVLVAIVQFALDFDIAAQIRPPGLVFNSEVASLDTRGGPGFARVRGFAAHPIEYGVVLGTVLPIAVHLAATARRRRWWRWAAVGLLAAGIPLSISRSAILAVAAGLLVVAVGWTWEQRVNALFVTLAGALMFMAITPGLLGTIKSLFVNFGTDESIEGRTQDFQATSAFIRDRPWLGRGPGTFVPTEYRYIDNEYLATLLHTGWLGFVAMFGVFVTAIVTVVVLMRNAGSEHERSLTLALGSAVAVALVVFATFDALGFPIYASLLTLFLGCLAALDRMQRRERVVGATDVRQRAASYIG